MAKSELVGDNKRSAEMTDPCISRVTMWNNFGTTEAFEGLRKTQRNFAELLKPVTESLSAFQTQVSTTSQGLNSLNKIFGQSGDIQIKYLSPIVATL
jgi:hypothetical protein